MRTLGIAHSLPVLMALHDGGPVGFLQLQRRMDYLHHTALTRALRKLEGDGFIERKPNLRSVIYDLSDRGRSLVPALRLIEAIAQGEQGSGGALKSRTPIETSSPAKPLVTPIGSAAEFEALVYALGRTRDVYHGTGTPGDASVRPRILDSWERCRELYVNPNRKLVVGFGDTVELRGANELLLRAAKPVLLDLADNLADTGFVAILTDARGYILELAGELDVRRECSRIGFEPGSDTSERGMGTNAIGTAIVDQRPLQTIAGEHFCDAGVPFTCTAAPIYAPMTRRLVGVLDITGSYKLARRHLMGAVLQAALEVEEQLAQL